MNFNSVVYLVTLKLCVVKFLQRIFHIFSSQIFHDTRAIFEDIRVTNISSLSHVIFEVLPTSCWRQSSHLHPVVAPPGWWSTSSKPSTSESTSTFGKLHFESVSVIIITISGIDCIFCISVRRPFQSQSKFQLNKVLTYGPQTQQKQKEDLSCSSGPRKQSCHTCRRDPPHPLI